MVLPSGSLAFKLAPRSSSVLIIGVSCPSLRDGIRDRTAAFSESRPAESIKAPAQSAQILLSATNNAGPSPAFRSAPRSISILRTGASAERTASLSGVWPSGDLAEGFAPRSRRSFTTSLEPCRVAAMSKGVRPSSERALASARASSSSRVFSGSSVAHMSAVAPASLRALASAPASSNSFTESASP